MKFIFILFFYLIVFISFGKELKGTGYSVINEDMTLEQAKKIAYNNAIKNAVENYAYIEYKSEYSTNETESKFDDRFSDLIKSNFEGLVKVISVEYKKEIQEDLIKINCFVILDVNEEEIKSKMNQRKSEEQQNNIHKASIDLEREKLQLEREKLRLEIEKLQLEKNKLNGDNQKDKYINENKEFFSEELKRPNEITPTKLDNNNVENSNKYFFLGGFGISFGVESLGLRYDDQRLFSPGMNMGLYMDLNFMTNPDFKLSFFLGMTHYFSRARILINRDNDHDNNLNNNLDKFYYRYFYATTNITYKSFFIGFDIGILNVKNYDYDFSSLKFSIRPRIGFSFWYFKAGLSYLIPISDIRPLTDDDDKLYFYPSIFLNLNIPFYSSK